MIRLAWSFQAADSIDPRALSQLLIQAEVAGVDLGAADAESALQIGRRFTEVQVPIICLASRASLPAHLGIDSAWLDPARQWVMAAAELGAQQLRLNVTHRPATRYRPSPVRLADQLAALAELAAKQDVRVVLETRDELAQPADLWRILELSESENLSACCSFDVADENPTDPSPKKSRLSQSNLVSTLNLRIRYVHIRGAQRESLQARAMPIVQHLRGIGYDGWIALEGAADSIQPLADAIRRIIYPAQAKPAPAALRK